MSTSKTITRICAILFLTTMCVYSSLIIGTLAHELTHKHYSYSTSVINVNYDTTGHAEGEFKQHEHRYVYFIHSVVEVSLIMLTMLSMIIIMWGDRNETTN